MLVSPSTVLARGKRQRVLVPTFRVSNLEMIETIIDSLVEHKKSAIISLHATKNTSPSLEWLYLCAKELVERQPIDIALQVVISPTKQMVERVMELGINSVEIEFEAGLSLKECAIMTSLVTQRLKGSRTEVTAVLPQLFSGISLKKFVQETSVSSISIPMTMVDSGREILSTKMVAEIHKTLQIPLIAHNEYLSESLIKQLKKTGVEGFVLHELLDKSFTAGLRTSLRNRDQHDPSVHIHKGLLAMKQTISHYLTIL